MICAVSILSKMAAEHLRQATLSSAKNKKWLYLA